MSETSIDSLNDRMNELRQRAFDRGGRPRVPGPLAADVLALIEDWRDWRAQSVDEPLNVGPLNEWVRRYNAMDTRVARAQGGGLRPTPPVPTITERAERAAISIQEGAAAVQEGAKSLGSALAWGALGLGVGLAVYYAASARKAARAWR